MRKQVYILFSKATARTRQLKHSCDCSCCSSCFRLERNWSEAAVLS